MSTTKWAIRLGKTEHIVCHYPSAPSGPGWANRLVWVVIRDRQTDTHRVESIQLDCLSQQARALFPVALAAFNGLAYEISKVTKVAR